MRLKFNFKIFLVKKRDNCSNLFSRLNLKKKTYIIIENFLGSFIIYIIRSSVNLKNFIKFKLKKLKYSNLMYN